MIKDILFMLVLFAANTVQTITGFAGNLLAMPSSVLLVGYENAKTVLNVFTLIVCAWITLKNRKYLQLKILLKMVFFMLIGMYIGIKIVKVFNLEILLYIYGIMIIAIGIKKLFIKKEIILPKWTMLFVLLAAGIIHGMFVSGGALLVIYAVWAMPDKDEFRATVSPVWVVLGIILMFSHYKEGYYTGENIILILMSMVPLVASIKLGNMLYNKINQKIFLKIIYVLFIISGILTFL